MVGIADDGVFRMPNLRPLQTPHTARRPRRPRETSWPIVAPKTPCRAIHRPGAMQDSITIEADDPAGATDLPSCEGPNVASPSTSHQPASERPDGTTSVLGILSTLAKEINKLNSTLATPASSQIPAVEPASRSTTSAQLHVVDSESGRPTKRRKKDDTDQNAAHVGASQTNPPHGSNYCSPVLEDVLDELLKVYFTRVQPWIPLLQEASFRRRLRTQGRDQVSVILHAMIAAALRFVKQDGQLLSPGLLELGTVEYLQLSVEDEGRPKRSSFIRPLFLLQEPKNWVEEEEEEEERRRVFWNIFILDRLNISVAYKVQMEHQLDSGRRVPSTASHYPSPSQSTNADGHEAEAQRSAGPQLGVNSAVVDMSTIGAFAYYIESIESLSRVNTLIFDWCNSGITREEMPGVMDLNMTVAHTTHNNSMILLHQRIAYPEPEISGIKLPRAYSAETCRGAASETANMVKKYLDSSPVDTLVSPQMSFCCFRDTPSVESIGDDLSAISRILMDQRFTEMDRIISYDDVMFNKRLEDFNAGSSDGWAAQGNELSSNRPAFGNPSGSFWNPN
ncbi:fungal specific transcription factor [Colletotrichum sojae]|uniref:Fungal specific transcription factor n=1 Tax=Colletotrichum sojae TaxID=2175907 RepID=A0A8H6IZJ7_9PEZI|nr:fungal specific transcription factor [Colletotrichum sojae]